jgi:hypothetical protein
MKRLALKISKELSVDRDLRATEGQAFLQECFAEFNTALEQGNPIEKKLRNHLSLVDPGKMEKKMSPKAYKMKEKMEGKKSTSKKSKY